MLLKQNLSIHRVLKITWKIDILMLGLCTIAFFVDTKLLPGVQLLPAVPTLIGTAIAFFIAFNNNQAYSRWWEARMIWGGIVNDSRSWARSLLVYTKDGDLARKMIVRHIAFLYAFKAGLRKTVDEEYKKILSPADIDHWMDSPTCLMPYWTCYPPIFNCYPIKTK
jgi:putative membrane protein